jgi:hypothetical protein
MKKIKSTAYTDTERYHSTLCHPSGKIKTHVGPIIDIMQSDEDRERNNQEWLDHMVKAAKDYCEE